MSVASHSQTNVVYYLSMDHAHSPVKHQPPSYDAEMGRQVKECKSTDDAPPVKALKNGVSEAALSAGRGHENRNVKWLPKDDERKSSGDAPRAGAPGNAVGSQKVAPAPEVTANLPSAAVLKKQIAQFLQKHFDKDAKKATGIVERIPNNDNQVKLNNILNVLTEIRVSNGRNYESLKEKLSWNSDRCPDDILAMNTTPEERLQLRALMLYLFSDFNKEKNEELSRNFAVRIGGIISDCGSGVKKMDAERLDKSYKQDAMSDCNYTLEPLKTVKEKLEAMTRDRLSKSV